MSDQAQKLSEVLRARGLMMSAAESCTGGLVAAAMTDIAGSSAVFERGFVTYSNEAKQELLGVPEEIIVSHGAVSEECAQAMALGAVQNSHADIAVSLTGIAGPGGGNEGKPVGLVYIAVAYASEVKVARNIFDGDRTAVRRQSVETALSMLIEALK